MKYFHNLPSEIVRLTNPFDHRSLGPNSGNHDWKVIWTSKFLTEEGINWFSDRGLFLREGAHLYKFPGNTEGPIHIDTTNPDQIHYAVNFVVEGYGVMEWLTDIEGDKYGTDYNKKHFDQYFSVKSFKVVESWNGTSALVRINTPHRVVGNTDRYTVSLRFRPPSPKTFEEALDILTKF